MTTLASLETRVIDLETKVAQLQSDIVTRRQFSQLAKDYEDGLAELTDLFTNIRSRLDTFASKIATLGAAVGETTSYTHTQGGASTTWTIQHNLGYSYPIIVAADTSNVMLVPSTITFTSTNVVTLTFATAKSGYAIITKVG